MGQCRPPRVKHAGHANPCAEALGIAAMVITVLRRRFEQQAIDGLLVPVGDAGDLRGQREDDSGSIPPAANPLPARPSSRVPPAPDIWGSACSCRVVRDVVWLHLVQAATCPPSASVRQASMEDITLSWLKG